MKQQEEKPNGGFVPFEKKYTEKKISITSGPANILGKKNILSIFDISNMKNNAKKNV